MEPECGNTMHLWQFKFDFQITKNLETQKLCLTLFEDIVRALQRKQRIGLSFGSMACH